MTFDVKIADNKDAKEWDDINDNSCLGTIFHQWKWLKITEKHTQTKLFPLFGLKSGNRIGIFPLFLKIQGPLRMVFSPPPHAALFYLGPVLAEYDSLKQEKREINYIGFMDAVNKYIHDDLHAQYTNISLSPELNDPRPFIWAGYSFEPQYDYVINLGGDRETLLRKLSDKQRQNISRAKKRGFVVEVGSKKEYNEILNLMHIRYAQQGKIVTPSRQYLLDIYDTYSDSLKVFIATINDDIVTGSIDFQYKDTHFSWIGNPKPRQPIAPSPNDLLIWESICFARQTGMKYYVTMNAAGNKRLHSYYASKFNPALKVHFSLKKSTVLMNILEKGYSGIIKSFR
jgi:hypothetical protein